VAGVIQYFIYSITGVFLHSFVMAACGLQPCQCGGPREPLNYACRHPRSHQIWYFKIWLHFVVVFVIIDTNVSVNALRRDLAKMFDFRSIRAEHRFAHHIVLKGMLVFQTIC
jgi:hypothetical protein